MITEKQYLEYLIKQYQNLIYSICLKSVGNPFDAEDLTQEVFLSAYKNLSRFDGTYEKAWLSKIAVRKCLDYLKAAGRRSIPTEDTYFSQIPDRQSSPCLLYTSCGFLSGKLTNTFPFFRKNSRPLFLLISQTAPDFWE